MEVVIVRGGLPKVETAVRIALSCLVEAKVQGPKAPTGEVVNPKKKPSVEENVLFPLITVYVNTLRKITWVESHSRMVSGVNREPRSSASGCLSDSLNKHISLDVSGASN